MEYFEKAIKENNINTIKTIVSNFEKAKRKNIGDLDKSGRNVKTADGWKPVRTHGHLVNKDADKDTKKKNEPKITVVEKMPRELFLQAVKILKKVLPNPKEIKVKKDKVYYISGDISVATGNMYSLGEIDFNSARLYYKNKNIGDVFNDASLKRMKKVIKNIRDGWAPVTDTEKELIKLKLQTAVNNILGWEESRMDTISVTGGYTVNILKDDYGRAVDNINIIVKPTIKEISINYGGFTTGLSDSHTHVTKKIKMKTRDINKELNTLLKNTLIKKMEKEVQSRKRPFLG